MGSAVLTAAVVRATFGLTAGTTAGQAFMLGHVVIESGERVKAAAAHRAVEVWFFIVFVVRQGSSRYLGWGTILAMI
jgi:mannose-6-phosphate isomerase-like protein (cupin superfamily)